MKNFNFILTYEQAMDICEFYGKDVTKLAEYEILELVDKFIDDCTHNVSFDD